MADIRINALTNTATSAASDDYLALDGSANGTRKILATNVAQNVTDVTFGSSGPSAKSSIAARASRQGLVFDGTASATNSAAAVGSSDFSIGGWVYQASAATAGLIGGASGGATLYVLSNGTLRVDKLGTGSNTASTGTVSAGKWSFVVYSRSGATGTYYINGIASGTSSDSFNYTGATAYIGGDSASGNVLVGSFVPFIYNRALSAAEVVALYEAGVPAGADYPSQVAGTAIITGNNSTFSGAGNWTNWTGTGSISVSGGQGNFTSNNALTTGVYLSAYLAQAGTILPGQRYRIKADVVSLSAGSIRVTDGTTNNIGTLASGTGTASLEFTAPSYTTGQIGFSGTVASSTFTLDNVTLVPLGLLLAPDAGQAGNGLVWTDLSGNGNQILLPTSGVSWNVPGTGTTRIRSYSYTNGNQQLFGASCVPVGYRIVSIAARLQGGGTPSVTLGSASGLSDYAASTSITSTSWKYVAIASGGEITTTANIWAGSNSTAVVLWDIIVQPLGI